MMLMQGSSETEREVSIKDFPFTSDGIVAVWCFCVPDGTAPDVSPRLPTEPVDIQNTRHTNVEANPWSLFLGRRTFHRRRGSTQKAKVHTWLHQTARPGLWTRPIFNEENLEATAGSSSIKCPTQAASEDSPSTQEVSSWYLLAFRPREKEIGASFVGLWLHVHGSWLCFEDNLEFDAHHRHKVEERLWASSNIRHLNNYKLEVKQDRSKLARTLKTGFESSGLLSKGPVFGHA
jgi:hypothetical protein